MAIASIRWWNSCCRTEITAPSIVLAPALNADLAASEERRRKFVQRILKSGVKFAAGSDMCWFYPGKTRGQASATMFANLHNANMPALDILRAVTVKPHNCWDGRIG